MSADPMAEPLRDWIVTFSHKVATERVHIAHHPGAVFVVMLNEAEAEGLLSQINEVLGVEVSA